MTALPACTSAIKGETIIKDSMLIKPIFKSSAFPLLHFLLEVENKSALAWQNSLNQKCLFLISDHFWVIWGRFFCFPFQSFRGILCNNLIIYHSTFKAHFIFENIQRKKKNTSCTNVNTSHWCLFLHFHSIFYGKKLYLLFSKCHFLVFPWKDRIFPSQ